MKSAWRLRGRRNRTRGLGPREEEVMAILRSMGSASVAEVHGVVSQREPLAYTTVMTILTRLANKGFVDRVLVGKAYRYSPQGTEEEMIQSVVGGAIEALLERFGRQAIVGFVSGLGRLDEQALADLEDLIRRRRAGSEGEGSV
ncbi:MAG: BlaI/MecI/CopY family transcriptional regulator [Chloroflexi bacterium]|nr:BlaI/MecI/CopY family transcriptional regulator [Chloroflexota bacterium]